MESILWILLGVNIMLGIVNVIAIIRIRSLLREYEASMENSQYYSIDLRSFDDLKELIGVPQKEKDDVKKH